MKVPLKLEVADFSSITLEPDSNGATEIPIITLGLNIKIPVMKLVSALTDFQNKHERATSSAKQAPSDMADPHAPHGEAVRGRVLQVAPAPAPSHSESQAFANGDGGPLQAPPPPPPLSSLPSELAPEPPPSVENSHSQGAQFTADWTTEISFLHSACHDEYARMVTWQDYIAQPEVESYWTCDEACIADYEPFPLDQPRLIYKKPRFSECIEDPYPEPIADIIYARLSPPPGAPPPPPSSPPPAPNSQGEDPAGNGTSATFNGAPPGLRAVPQIPRERGAAPPSVPRVPRNGSRSAGSECKQQ